MKCIIPCAGESSRMSYIPKHLVRVGDKPLLMHVVDMWKDSVDAFIFVLQRSATYLWKYLPANSIVVFQDEPRGLADAVLRAEKCVDDQFMVVLGDCVQHGKLFVDLDSKLGIGVWKTCSVKELNKSYLVEVQEEVVSRVVEKPNLKEVLSTRNCGMGTYFLDSRVFDYIRKSSVTPGGGDFTHVIQDMIDASEVITPFWFEGKYVNVTYPEDIRTAEEILR